MILCDEGKSFMHWKWFYQLRDYLKSSLWIVPLVAIPLELAAIRILQRLDSLLGWSFLGLAFTKICFCGEQNMQIARRLRAMIENLIQTLPKHRHAILQSQLALLDRDIEKYFGYPEDLALARVGDTQGLGGASGVGHMQQ